MIAAQDNIVQQEVFYYTQLVLQHPFARMDGLPDLSRCFKQRGDLGLHHDLGHQRPCRMMACDRIRVGRGM